MMQARWMVAAAVAVVSAGSAVAQVTFRGLEHAPVGSATLFVLGPDLLEVTMPVAGFDGVSVDLTEAESATGTYSGLNPGPLASGSVWQAETFKGALQRASLTLTNLGASWELDASFFVSGPRDVEVYIGDTLVASATGVTGPFGSTTAGAFELLYVRQVDQRLETELTFDAPSVVTLNSQPAVTADRIVIRSASFLGTLGVIESVEVTATQINAFFVEDATIGVFDNQQRALGQAELSASGICPACTLTLSNIGSSGLDGYRTIFPEPIDGITVGFGPFGQPSGPDPRISATMYGVVDGVPDSEIASFEISDARGSRFFSPDFSGIGASTRTVRIYDGNTLIAQQTGLGGSAVASWDLSSAYPTHWRGALRDEPELATTLTLEFGGLVDFDVPGLGIEAGNRLVVIAENAGSGAFTIGSTDGQQGDLPGLDVVQQDEDPFCQGDFNNSNTVDLSDLGILLVNFGLPFQGVEDGDTTGDGDVDIEDLANTLAAFGSNCQN